MSGLGYASLIGHDGKGNSATLDATGLTGSAAVGGTPFRGLVIGGTLGAMAASIQSVQAGALVEWYPLPHGGWHVGLELGAIAVSVPLMSTRATGYGAVGLVEGGYDWWIGPELSLGLDLFASSGTALAMLDGSGNDTGYRFTPLQLGLGLRVVFH
jgi:hypothetical protein